MEDLTGKMSSKLLQGGILGKSVQIDSVYELYLNPIIAQFCSFSC